MKIGFITPEYPHEKIAHAAGIGTSIKNLAMALVKKGVAVYVFVYNQKASEVFNDKGVEIHSIAKKKFSYLGWYFSRKYVQNQINKIVSEKQIAILEAPDWTGITAFMRFKVPLVIRFHGSDAYFCKLEGRQQKFKNFVFEKQALRNADAYLAPTNFAGEETREIFGIKSSKINTVSNGVLLSDFTNESPEIYIKNTILYVGTIIRKKGVFELAKIFNKVAEQNPEAQLVLIGSDSADIKTGQKSTYNLIDKLFSAEAKNRVKYLGKLPYNDVQQQIKQAHVCVFPSFAETLGMVTIEAMALQKPVVNTSIGWAQELIDDGKNGFLIHPTETNLYAEKILELLHNEDLCRSIGAKSRVKVVETFDIDKIADINLNYYKSLL
ncbi:glycosyltransferase family 4 protein [Tamlana sp. 62-3]|uniref:Glycosyltransferase family 4 protein n=1 Tax=Neotamlana sargassicola TaxID=2883125 RepID=A0A9X1L7C2_9FLAO|nr:glycosyltransferase family 4 protein [Tamlana sargassicola]MCB4808716.1 glycosyltransferase family 4 protein [Tamlana sargassicola]